MDKEIHFKSLQDDNNDLEDFTLAYQTHLRKVRLLIEEQFLKRLEPVAFYMGQVETNVRLQGNEDGAVLVKTQFEAVMTLFEEMVECVDTLAKDVERLANIHAKYIDEFRKELNKFEKENLK